MSVTKEMLPLKGTLKQYRSILGYTQKEVAEKLGVSTVTYREYEKNPLKAPFEKIVELSMLYGIEVSQIIFFDCNLRKT